VAPISPVSNIIRPTSGGCQTDGAQDAQLALPFQLDGQQGAEHADERNDGRQQLHGTVMAKVRSKTASTSRAGPDWDG